MSYRKLVLISENKYNKLSSASSNETNNQNTNEVAPLNRDVILKSVPKNFRTRADSLLEHLEQGDIISWNSIGEIIYAGVTIQQSNISDLLRFSMREYATFTPVGIEQFTKALAHANAPETLIGNLDLSVQIRNLKNTQSFNTNEEKTKDQKNPPGIREKTWISY